MTAYERSLYERSLSEIFSKQEYSTNLVLFKKILLLAREGMLQVNGQFPDASKSLFENLVEGHSFVVDLTQLEPNYRHKLKTWLLDPHQNDCRYSFWEGYVNNDYRGYTVEVPLSWWGRFYNWLFSAVETAYWPLTSKKKLTSDFNLHGFTLQMGKQGWLLEFKSTHLEKLFSFPKKVEDYEKARNSRRIVLTPGIVDKLIKVKTVDERIYKQVHKPHPFSINVQPKHKAYRYQSMANFRKTEFIEENPSWFANQWRWIVNALTSMANYFYSIAHENDNQESEAKLNTSTTQAKTAATKHIIFDNNEIRITKQNNIYQIWEKWSGYKNLVCSGGGGKIFALVGALGACRERGIPFTAFAGSSAGAIISILAYLDYDYKIIARFFADFNSEILLYNEWDRTGYSKTTALKAALDYMIAIKVLNIIKRYQIDKSVEGRNFLNHVVFNQGKITFRSLKKLKQRYPNCGLGDELILTASNMQSQRTTYFSYKTTPYAEVSHAGEMSGSIPPLLKPPEYLGVPHTDGGLTSNFPSEVFIGKDKSLLSSRYGYSIETLGFCFNSGPEEGMVNNFRKSIYRESFIANWFYRLISGILDPVGAWVWDRIKMVQQSFTTVLLPADVPATQFTIPPKKQEELIKKGYDQTIAHLDHLYVKKKNGKIQNEKNGQYQPCQLMFENFQSFEAILVHCCFRQNKKLFDELVPIAKQYEPGITQKRIDLLARRFDKPDPIPEYETPPTPRTTCKHKSNISHTLSNLLLSKSFTDRMRFFTYVYPIFLRMRLHMFDSKKDYGLFCKARHGTSINNPFYAIPHLKKLGSRQNLILFLASYCLKNYSYNQYKDTSLILKNLSGAVLADELDWTSATYINNWSDILNEGQLFEQLLDAIRRKNWRFLNDLVVTKQNWLNQTDSTQLNKIKSGSSASSTKLNDIGEIKSCAY